MDEPLSADEARPINEWGGGGGGVGVGAQYTISRYLFVICLNIRYTINLSLIIKNLS